MNKERSQKIESYGDAYQKLVTALGNLPREMWHFRADENGWTVHEIIIHIADSEANSYVRCRRFLAEPGSAVLGYDENRWARELDYSSQDADAALKLFRWLRHNTHQLIKDLPESVWSNTVNHSENGIMTLDDWLDTYDRHILDHIRQMEEIHTAWERR